MLRCRVILRVLNFIATAKRAILSPTATVATRYTPTPPRYYHVPWRQILHIIEFAHNVDTRWGLYCLSFRQRAARCLWYVCTCNNCFRQLRGLVSWLCSTLCRRSCCDGCDRPGGPRGQPTMWHGPAAGRHHPDRPLVPRRLRRARLQVRTLPSAGNVLWRSRLQVTVWTPRSAGNVPHSPVYRSQWGRRGLQVTCSDSPVNRSQVRTPRSAGNVSHSPVCRSQWGRRGLQVTCSDSPVDRSQVMTPRSAGNVPDSPVYRSQWGRCGLQATCPTLPSIGHRWGRRGLQVTCPALPSTGHRWGRCSLQVTCSDSPVHRSQVRTLRSAGNVLRLSRQQVTGEDAAVCR